MAVDVGLKKRKRKVKKKCNDSWTIKINQTG